MIFRLSLTVLSNSFPVNENNYLCFLEAYEMFSFPLKAVTNENSVTTYLSLVFTTTINLINCSQVFIS